MDRTPSKCTTSSSTAEVTPPPSARKSSEGNDVPDVKIGYKFLASVVGGGFEEGTVIKGPIEVELDSGEFSTAWIVQYVSGRQQDLTVQEILRFSTEKFDEDKDPSDDDDPITDDSRPGDLKRRYDSEQHRPVRSSKRTIRPPAAFIEESFMQSRESQRAKKTQVASVDLFKTAKASLLFMPGISEEEAQEALQAVGHPYGLNSAMAYIREKRGKTDTYTNRAKFMPHAGMGVRVGDGRTQCLGQVTSEGRMKEIDGGKLRMWEVTYEDGEKEELDWRQLFEARADRPRRTTQNLSGRPLECLEIFSGRGIVSQQFAQRMWTTRGADTLPISTADTSNKWTPDFIWACPPCFSYSRDEQNQLFKGMVQILHQSKRNHKHLIAVIENPFGLLYDIPIMKALEKSFGLRRITLNYCGFGQCNHRPTYLWTNDFGLASTLSEFRCDYICPFKDAPHPSNIRGDDRQIHETFIPDALIEEIVEYVNSKFILDRIRHTRPMMYCEESSLGIVVPARTYNLEQHEISTGFTFAKQFDDGKFYDGRVIGGPEPVIEDTGEVVPNYRVIYQDGLEEDMSADEIFSCPKDHPARSPEVKVEVPIQIGYVFFKRFEGDKFYEGRVIKGPERVRDEKQGCVVSIFCVQYSDGDHEDMTYDEILNCPRDDPTVRLEAARKARSASRTNYEKNLNSLLSIPGITESEVEAALKETGPSHSSNEALAHIYGGRLCPNKYEEVRAFQPCIGMKIRYSAYGEQYLGEVTSGARMKEVEDGEVEMWEVTYEDGGIDDMTHSQLLQAWANRPTRIHPHRGRPLDSLELFSGCGMVSQQFAQRMWRIRSVDNERASNATDKVDFMNFELKNIGFVPDFIWASPPCFTYSNMAGGRHRSSEKEYEKTKEALEQNHLFTRMVRIMHEAKAVHPHLIVVIENPRGLLQNMPLMKELESSMELEKVEVHYCAFGRGDQKPTHLWTNDFGLAATLSKFRCDHRCPYKGGVHPIGVRSQGTKFNAAAIPGRLAEEVASYVNAKFILDRIRLTKSHSFLPPPDEAVVAITDTTSSSENTLASDC